MKLYVNKTKDLIMMSKTASSESKTQPNFNVVAIGRGAINAQNHMIDSGMQCMDFIAVGSNNLNYSCP